jgi:hypothetical protein
MEYPRGHHLTTYQIDPITFVNALIGHLFYCFSLNTDVAQFLKEMTNMCQLNLSMVAQLIDWRIQDCKVLNPARPKLKICFPHLFVLKIIVAMYAMK